MLNDAYRQNRMSTAAAVRHLHSVHVKAPVFGLVWSDGRVRAHVDWCVDQEQESPVRTNFPEERIIAYAPLYIRSFVLLFSQAPTTTMAGREGATPTNGTWIVRET